MIERALVSVWDKAGLDELATGLADLGVELVASGGTAAHLEELGAARPLERARPGPVRRDGDDRQARVDQRLEVRPLAADEDADHAASTRPITSSSPGSGTTAQ